MNEDFVPFELAVKLKEKGFREKCLYRYKNYSKTLHINEVETLITRDVDYSEFFKCYNSYVYSDIDAPTISQVLKWLREEKKIHIVIDFDGGMSWYYQIALYGLTAYEKESEHKYNSYEQAALAGIEFVLDNLI